MPARPPSPALLAVPADLWDRADVRAALAATDIGALIRLVRQHTGASQTTVGARIGLAQPDVSDIERGHRHVTSAEVLQRIAAGLDVPPGLLRLPAGDPPDTGPRGAPSPTRAAARVTAQPNTQEDDVRRRQLLTAGLGLGTGLAPVGNARADQPIESALFAAPAAAAQAPRELAAALTTGRGHYTAARYTALGDMLPGLVAAAESTRDAARPGHDRDRAHAAVARAYVLATDLAVKRHDDIAWACADRALASARASGDPLAIAEAARALAITMRRGGRGTLAVGLLTSTAHQLAERGTTTGQLAPAARVALLLTAAYTAATIGDRHDAEQLMAEAEHTVNRLPGTATPGLFATTPSTAECTVYRVSVYNALGTPDDGIPHARRIPYTELADTERAARALTDTTRMWHALGEHARAYDALLVLERTAPEEVRRPAVRTLIASLVYAPARLPGIRELAARAGAMT